MLNLEEETPFAKGGHRACYRHPNDSGKCIKVMTEDWRMADRRLRAHWIVRMCRPKWYFHENLAEYRILKSQEKRVGEVAWDYVPRAYEVISTDVGDGLVVDLIQDHDGGISMTLTEYLWKNGLTKECQAALDTMWEGVERFRIFVQGRPDNLVVQQKLDGTCQCIAIDGFGFPQLIPLTKWCKKEARRKIARRKMRQQEAIEKFLEKRKEGVKVSEKGFLLSR